MAGRFTGPTNVTLSGNKEVAASHIIYVRLIAKRLIDRIKQPPSNGRGVLQERRELSDGSTVDVLVQLIGLTPLVKAEIHTPELVTTRKDEPSLEGFSYIFLITTWLPEGLVLTPNSVDAPHGYGFPKRDSITGELINYPFGTKIEAEEDICRNQCLFNKYKNNKYLDHPDYIKGLEKAAPKLPDNPRLRNLVSDKVPTDGFPFYRYGPIGYESVLPPAFDRSFWDDNFYEYIDIPGLNSQPSRGEAFVPFKYEGRGDNKRPKFRQFGANESVLTIFEDPTDTWFCHWGEELLYENKTFESVFQECNRLRREIGREPLIRPIRGLPSGAWMTVTEVQRARVQFHNNEEKYRPGRGYADNRVFSCGLTANASTGENILTCGVSNLNSESAGASINKFWEASPYHYANIISDEWSSPKGSTFLDIAGGMGATITETGDPYPNVYDPPVRGYTYAQWFQSSEQYNAWVWSGLVVNETRFGKVSVRVAESWIGTQALMDYRYLLFFAGRLFIVGPALSSPTQIILGATAFLGEEGRMWFRAIFLEAGVDAEFIVYVSPMCNSDKELQWTEEARVPLYYVIGTNSSFQRTRANFNFEGTHAVFTVCAEVGEFAEMWFTGYSPPEPRRSTIAAFNVFYSEGQFTSSRVQAPKLVFENEVVYDESDSKYYCTRYTQKAEGEYEAYPFYNKDGELTYFRYVFELDSTQYKTSSATFVCQETLIFPSGKTLPIKQFDLAAGHPVSGSECFITVVLYLDPAYEDVVYAKAPLRRAGSNVYASLEIWYNETLLKTYPEELVSNSYPSVDPLLTSGWTSIEPESANQLNGMVDIHFFINTYTDGRTYPFPLARRTEPFVFCTDLPSIYYDYRRPCVGEHSLSISPRYGMGSYCVSTDSPPTINWAYDVGLPFCASNRALVLRQAEDSAICEFARYQDRVVLDIFFRQLCGVRYRDTEGNVDTYGEHIVWANFPVDEEVGIGPLTTVMPLGVI